ncbi:hypothetical protein [Acetobacterium sp.]|jgi:integrase|uniref:hypothetical protein n=1 Tax=Acetobacterium sp. TaxID=1872094 RepID=UPI0027201D8C|nr:hypothetical protein [Acetobacterium sp.]MDO9491289.1 hypothetical protein [Acetobacterium sp.]
MQHYYSKLGKPAKTVQELLGHSNVNITLGTYTHVLETQKTKTDSLIDALYDTEEIANVIFIG